MRALRTLLCVLVLAMAAGRAAACPFCAAVSPSLSNRLDLARFAVIARMTGNPHPDDPRVREISFAPTQFLKGTADQLGDQPILAPIPQDPDADQAYFIMGAVDTKTLERGEELVWALPVPVTDAAADYVLGLEHVPASGPERLAFFIPYLHAADPMVAQDAYDEFGAAPYADVKAVADRLPREELKLWVADPNVPANTRRLYVTLLGVCGSEADAPALWNMIESSVATAGPDRTLDAMVACYLTLRGSAGLPEVNRLLADPQVSVGDAQAAVMALRFHGEEETIIPRQELSQSLRLMLARPEAADIVIRDLARWEDWGALDEIVKLFRESSAEHQFLRVPIVKFLQVCPLPEAAVQLAAIERDFPDVVKRANLLPFELGQRRAVTRPGDQDNANPTGSSATAPRGNAPLANTPENNGAAPAEGTSPPPVDATSPQNTSPQNTSPQDAPLVAAPPQEDPGFFTNGNMALVLVGAGIVAVLAIFLILRRG